LKLSRLSAEGTDCGKLQLTPTN